eukprot:15351416-Ditylum_brightwellii.AAC.2
MQWMALCSQHGMKFPLTKPSQQKIQPRNMQLHVDSDAAYLVLNGAKSCITIYFYCTTNPHVLKYNYTSQHSYPC